MAVKTITIDLEAYDLLVAQKGKKESFSKVIKRRLSPQKNAKALLKNLKKCALTEETLEQVAGVVAARGESFTDIPTFD